MQQPDWATVETLIEEDRLPKSGGAILGVEAMTRAVVCTEDQQGERQISGDVRSLSPNSHLRCGARELKTWRSLR